MGFRQHSAEASLQEVLLVLEEDSQAAAAGGKVEQHLMAEWSSSWQEKEAVLYHEMAHYQTVTTGTEIGNVPNKSPNPPKA